MEGKEVSSLRKLHIILSAQEINWTLVLNKLKEFGSFQVFEVRSDFATIGFETSVDVQVLDEMLKNACPEMAVSFHTGGGCSHGCAA